MRKYFCNRCNIEINLANGIDNGCNEYICKILNISIYNAYVPENFDLCYKCSKEIETIITNWFEKGGQV